MLIFELAERCVRYNDTTLGSVGSELNPCLAQKAPKSLKSDLYALSVLLALELLNFLKFHHEAFLHLLITHSYLLLLITINYH